MGSKIGFASLACLCSIICLHVNAVTLRKHQREREDAIHHLFQKLDNDGDGQIQETEARRYIESQVDAAELAHDGTSASEHFMASDGLDNDSTVSEEELHKSLAERLKVRYSYYTTYHSRGLEVDIV
jgi:Ca2+-binding EF-hand superfamily protein